MSVLKAFNNHLLEFVEDVIRIFPTNLDIKTGKTFIEGIKRVNPKKIITYWRDNILMLYEKEILNGDISFFINKNEKVLTEVYNDKNDLIWKYKFDAKKGFNEFRWDIIYEKTKSDLPYFIHYNKYLPAGKYKLNLKLSDENFEESFNVCEYNN